tara:strand:- start:4149 stop:5018 length:870 start_codon:yes stop_codon:yes gene_type:complete
MVPSYFDHILEHFNPAESKRAVHLGLWLDESESIDCTPGAQQQNLHWEIEKSGDDFSQAQSRLNHWLLNALNPHESEAILDVGCGLGSTIELLNQSLQQARLVGVNIDDRQLQACRSLAPLNNNRLQWQLADACSLPFPDNSFDSVISVEAMFHFSSRREFFREVARVLKPGGRFVATDMITSASLQQLATPGFMIEAAVEDGYGPWPDFWGREADHQQLAESVGMKTQWYRDISAETLPSYAYTTPSKVDWLNDSGDSATRSALALRWLQEQSFLKYVAMGFIHEASN